MTPAIVVVPKTGVLCGGNPRACRILSLFLPLSSLGIEANNPCNPMRIYRSPDPPRRRPFSRSHSTILVGATACVLVGEPCCPFVFDIPLRYLRRSWCCPTRRLSCSPTEQKGPPYWTKPVRCRQTPADLVCVVSTRCIVPWLGADSSVASCALDDARRLEIG